MPDTSARAIPATNGSTRHDVRGTSLDKPVDLRGTASGCQVVCPQRRRTVDDILWRARTEPWTAVSPPTRENGSLSTIHRTYYPHYRFHTNKTVLTTAGLNRADRSAIRPDAKSQKNRECQR